MFHIAYRELRNQDFADAITKISSCTTFASAKISYNAGRIIRDVAIALNNMQAEFIELLREYAVLDDKGGFAAPEGQPAGNYQIIPDRLETWRKVLAEFLEQSISIHRHKLELDSLSPCGLTPKEVIALEPILLLN